MSTIRNLAANLRPASINDLRMELRELRAGETLMLSISGREFVVVCGSDWARLIEEAGETLHVPDRFDNA